MLLWNCCRLRGWTEVVKVAQMKGGSPLGWRNFLLNLSPKLCCNLRKEVVVATFSHDLLLVCPPCTSPTRSLPVFSRPLWVTRGTSSPHPSPLLSLSTNLPLWACVVGSSPLLITATLKATCPSHRSHPLQRWASQSALQGCFSVGVFHTPSPHLSLREALQQPCHPMNQGFSGTPHSSVPGCWLFSWHAALLADGSPALHTPLPGFTKYQLFLERKTKKELSPFSFLSPCGCMWCLGIILPAKPLVTEYYQTHTPKVEQKTE